MLARSGFVGKNPPGGIWAHFLRGPTGCVAKPKAVDRAHWPTKENRQRIQISRSMEKLGPDGPNWGQDDFFPADPDLADIFGRTDFDFENFYFFDFFGSQISGLGPAWARLGPGLGPGLGPELGPELGPSA